MSIVKTGFDIDGVEVTSEHVGKNLKVIKSSNSRWLPVNFIATIAGVRGNGEITLQDTGGVDSHYDVDLESESDCWGFEWVTPVKPKKSSTKPMRQKLAKAIREAKSALDLVVSEAEEVGMVVDISKDCVKITFNPPLEDY